MLAGWTLVAVTAAATASASPAAPSPPAPSQPALSQLSLDDVAHRVEALWKHRDDPAAMAEAKVLLDQALARGPDDYEILRRFAAWYFWKSDDPALSNDAKAKLGKQGWDLAERAIVRAPGRSEGYFWAALTMGNYSLGLGIVRAIAQRIEGKFRARLGEAERLAPRYGVGAVQNAWGRYYATLPWPKRDEKKAAEWYGKA